MGWGSVRGLDPAEVVATVVPVLLPAIGQEVEEEEEGGMATTEEVQEGFACRC